MLWNRNRSSCSFLTWRNPNRYYQLTSGFWPRVRARALRAPVFLSSLPPPKGRCAPPRPVHRSYEVWGPPAPAPPIAASLILPAIFWGQRLKIMYRCIHTPYFFRFFFSIFFESFLFVILFFFFSPFQFLLILLFLFFSSYPSHLISSYSSRVLFCVFFFFSFHILNCLLHYRHEY